MVQTMQVDSTVHRPDTEPIYYATVVSRGNPYEVSGEGEMSAESQFIQHSRSAHTEAVTCVTPVSPGVVLSGSKDQVCQPTKYLIFHMANAVAVELNILGNI